jgi:hypothetical protein
MNAQIEVSGILKQQTAMSLKQKRNKTIQNKQPKSNNIFYLKIIYL